jgi:hypothetical protein
LGWHPRSATQQQQQERQAVDRLPQVLACTCRPLWVLAAWQQGQQGRWRGRQQQQQGWALAGVVVWMTSWQTSWMN